MWEKVWHRSIFLAVFMTIAIIMLLILSHNSTFSPSFYHFQQEQEQKLGFLEGKHCYKEDVQNIEVVMCKWDFQQTGMLCKEANERQIHH